MIVVWLLQAFLLGFDLTLGNLPTSPTLGLNAKATTVVGTGIFDGAGWLNSWVPLDAVMEGLGVVLTLFVFMWIVRVAIYLLSKIHILGGGDD